MWHWYLMWYLSSFVFRLLIFKLISLEFERIRLYVTTLLWTKYYASCSENSRGWAAICLEVYKVYQVMCSWKQDTMVSSSQPNCIRSVSVVTREVLLSILRPADGIWGYLRWMLFSRENISPMLHNSPNLWAPHFDLTFHHGYSHLKPLKSNFWNSKVMATSFKSRGLEFYLPSHHQFIKTFLPGHFYNS